MLKLSLDALEIVETIARKGSFAGAAKELFRVPSTISCDRGGWERQAQPGFAK